MKTIDCWDDLRPCGIIALTGEACGLSYRLLCDVTAGGKALLEKVFSVPELRLAENWNRGDPDDPHIGSIMLTPEMRTPIGVFALLESGCTEVWLYQNGGLLGVEPHDPPDKIETCRMLCPEALDRTFR